MVYALMEKAEVGVMSKLTTVQLFQGKDEK